VQNAPKCANGRPILGWSLFVNLFFFFFFRASFSCSSFSCPGLSSSSPPPLSSITDTLKWGYACCWQTTKAAFCVGEDGKKAILEGKRWLQEAGQSEKSKGTGVNHANAADKKREERPNFDKSGTRNDGWDRDGDFNAMGTREAIDQEKLQKAMAEEREKKRTSKNEGNKAEKPSGFGESYSDETPEIIEARKLLKERKNDPMASMGNELLPMESGDKKKNDQLRQTA
jgi:hypothetical protein